MQFLLIQLKFLRLPISICHPEKLCNCRGFRFIILFLRFIEKSCNIHELLKLESVSNAMGLNEEKKAKCFDGPLAPFKSKKSPACCKWTSFAMPSKFALFSWAIFISNSEISKINTY